MPAETAVPPAVEIPTETIIDIASQLYALEERLLDLCDRQESEITEALSEMAWVLLGAAALDDAGRADFRHPLAVEACARAAELRAVWYEAHCDARQQRRAAARIRAHRNGLAPYMTDEELAREGAGDG